MAELDYINLTPDLQQILSTEQAWHYQIVPKEQSGNKVTILVVDLKKSNSLKNELEILLGKNVHLEEASLEVINKTLGKYYLRNSRNQTTEAISSTENSDDFLQALILEAKTLGSSDIHIECYDEKSRVRIRVDGVLIERYSIKKGEYPALINKIKIKANLDIAEKRLPQDGRIYFNYSGKKIDIRVSILPTLYGEKIVLRLLNNDATNINIQDLGFSEEELSHYLEGIKRPNGIILISGPTGSGKTTTLYATLKILNSEKTNILTIEDPIEYTLPGINQVQLKESIGLTFASGLRTFLRQDPDVIMLGEIRDGETAQMAIRAALTGHLVLSTIHTNSAWGTISRLVDMGIPSFLLANTLNTSVAQRLVKLLCTHCKKEEKFNIQLLPRNFKAPGEIKNHYTAAGCEHCFYTGYRGRTAIYEIIPIDQDLNDEIKKNNLDIHPTLRRKNIRTLSDNAFYLFDKGLTSIDEVYPILLQHY